MAKNLVIVESPAKAKTIEKYLGKDFTVKSSYGHVRDLPKKGMGIDIDNQFTPQYEISEDKKQVIKELKKLVKDAQIIWLATDEDREGEAISWHLYEALNLEKKETKRITFNEITKPAILKAIESPRQIDIDLVNAQQARRILDRLVGFELSPVLWRKVKPSLSAGRVQSVAVRLIVEREREISSFQAKSSFKVKAIFTVNGKTISSNLNKSFDSKEKAEAFIQHCVSANFSIADVSKKPLKRSPAAPFTTSTLQQEASRKLGMSVSRTMSLAQRLYEAGLITYMRTDSVNLSDTAIQGAVSEINTAYGDQYTKIRKYSSKTKGAQEAHEAIRPTNFTMHSGGKDASEQRLYELIWKRAIASQMSDAQIEKTTIKINVSGSEYYFNTTGEVIQFDGFLKVYLEGTDDEDNNEDENETLLPKVNIGDFLQYKSIVATERYTRPPARYTEAALVKKLEELGIGRPSTYAPTISTVQKRGYITKDAIEGKKREYSTISLNGSNQIKIDTQKEIYGADKNKMHPTDIGMVVNDFLVDNFKRILDYNFTATVEGQFDEIANGQLQWNNMITKFYDPFHKNVEDTIENSERATGERELGIDPTSSKKVIARIGRFGPMIQIGHADDEEKPKFASLKANQSINEISLEEALELFKLPRKLGEFEGKVVTAAIGRFGPYVRHDSKFVSIPKDTDDPISISLERAVQLIEAKREADKNKFIKEFDHDPPVQILNGRWGPYIKIGKKNVKIPKDVIAEDLTLEQCLELEKKAPAKKTRKKK